MAGIKRKSDAEDAVERKRKGPKKPKVSSAPSATATDTKSSRTSTGNDTAETEVFEGFDPDPRELKKTSGDKDKKRRDWNDGNGSVKRSGGDKSTKRGLEAGTSSDANGSSSKEAHAKQKALAQERKAAKPNASQIQRSKKIWERLRIKSRVPLEERNQLVTELFDILTGHFTDFVFKHDAVRVVQTAVKYGNLAQRKMIAEELKGHFRSLAESRYAKFLVGKLLVHGTTEMREMIISEFYGHVRRLIRHPEASWILDDIYRGVATPQQKANLLREWYGPEYALFTTARDSQTTERLSEILKASPEKRAPIMRHLLELINQLVQKKTTGFTMLHDAMLEYFLNIKSGSEEKNDFIELLGTDEEGDLLKNLAFTKSGSKVVCLALAHGTAKDRRHILKSYKDIIQMMSFDVNGHMVLLTCYEVIDDTVSLSKTIISSLVGKDKAVRDEEIMNTATDLNGRIALLYLPAGRVKWLLTDEEIAFLDEIDQIRSNTSKKDPAARRQELLQTLSPPLLQTIEKSARSLCQSSFGCQFVSEALLGCVGDKTKALEAVAEAATGDPSAPGGQLAGSAAGCRMLKTLVLGGRFDAKLGRIEVIDPPLGFHELLYDRIKPQLIEWATGPSSFVVVGLLEAPGFSRRDEVLQTLTKHRRALKTASTATVQEKKARSEESRGSKRKKTAHDGPPAANRGAALLLEKLT